MKNGVDNLIDEIKDKDGDAIRALIKPYFQNKENLIDSASAALESISNNSDLCPQKSKKPIQLDAWCKKFCDGYDNRSSVRKSKISSMKPDPIIQRIIECRLKDIPKKNIKRMIDAHRICMAAENILGHFLEEYISINLDKSNWHVAWGSTIRSVDLCNSKDKRMLQIKNRSNSENSSSSKVRNNTCIEKWYRIDAKTGECNWENLGQILGVGKNVFSEKKFIDFIKESMDKNPESIAIE